jgi:hypothetical protein
MNRPGSAISKAKVIKSSGNDGTQLRAVYFRTNTGPTEDSNPIRIH